MTLLAIDVGNTRLKWALHAAPRRDAPILAQGVEFLENIEKLGEGDWARITQLARAAQALARGGD